MYVCVFTYSVHTHIKGQASEVNSLSRMWKWGSNASHPAGLEASTLPGELS